MKRSAIFNLLVGEIIIASLVPGCKEKPELPVVETIAVTQVNQVSASTGGNVTSDGGEQVIARGVCWNKSGNPTITDNLSLNGDGTGSFVCSITSLTPNTVYYVRAYATNGVGTSYGNQFNFRTLQVSLPTVTTHAVSNITGSTALGGGDVRSDGGSQVTARGLVWNTFKDPTLEKTLGTTSNGSGKGSFSGSITGLSTSKTYYVRAYATNSVGTAYGDFVGFTTLDYITFTDSRDDHVYRATKIGTQWWMTENLAYLPSVNPGETGSSTLPFYYVYWYGAYSVSGAKATVNYATFGVLYNWVAAMDGWNSSSSNPSGVKGACPTGWHLPSNAEWALLGTYLGGDSFAGGKLKEAGTATWNPPNSGATNESGFTGLPGGFRHSQSSFDGLRTGGYWWSSTVYTDYTNVWSVKLDFGSASMIRSGSPKASGFSVRCVRD